MSDSIAPTRSWPERAVFGGLLALAAFVPLAWSKWAASTYFAPKFALLLAVTIWLAASLGLRAVWEGEVVLPRAVHVATALFVVWTAVTTIASTSWAVSLIGRANYGEGLLSILGYGVVLYAASSVDWDEECWRRLAVALAAGAVVIAAICALQLLGRDDLLLSLGLAGMGVRGRISGTLGNPVYLGGYVTVALPLVVTLALRARRWMGTSAAGLVAAALLFLALASFTRASWLGITAGAIVFVLVGRQALAQARSRALVLASLFAVLTVATVLAFGTTRSGTIAARVASLTQLEEGSASMRPAQWRVAATMVGKRPVVGWGPAQYRLGFDRYASIEQLQLEAATSNDAHNWLLNTAATTGIPGAAMLVLVFVTLLTGVVRTWPSRAPRDSTFNDVLYPAAAAAGAAGYAVWAMLNPSSVGITPLFWLLAGTLVPGRVHRVHTAPRGSQGKLMLTLVAVTGALLLSIFPYRYLAADQAALAGTITSSPEELLVAVRLNPLMPSYYWELAKAYRQRALDTQTLEPLDEARAVMRHAETLSREFELYATMANIEMLTAQGSENSAFYAMAVQSLRKALAARPLSGIARLNLGYVYLQMADYRNAAKWLRNATKVPPPDARSYYLLGLSLEKVDQPQAAYDAYRQALVINPDYREAADAAEDLAARTRRDGLRLKEPPPRYAVPK